MQLQPATPLTPLQGTIVGAMLRRVWGTVRWENAHKEALWRLAVDGIPLLGNSHMRGAPVRPCGCGGYAAGSAGGASPRMHHFWRCEVAQAVVGQLEGTLGTRVTREAVWLAQAPSGVQQCVWDVVVLAGVSAMELGRRFMQAATRERLGPPRGPPMGRAVPGAELRDRAIRRAVADFWARLHGFARLGRPRKGWQGVGPSHPFLRGVPGALQCTGPVVEAADGSGVSDSEGSEAGDRVGGADGAADPGGPP